MVSFLGELENLKTHTKSSIRKNFAVILGECIIQLKSNELAFKLMELMLQLMEDKG